jgi:hypothetical protein
LFSGALRFNEERKPPLVVDRATIVGFARRPFDLNALHLAGAQEQVVSAVDQDLDRHAVHHRRLDRSGACDLDAAEAAGRRRRRERRRSLEEFTPLEIRHGRLPL